MNRVAKPLPRAGIWWAGAIALALVLSGCGSSDEAAAERPVTAETILIDGSSTVFPITREAARRYARADRSADLRVSFSGTTGGFRRFCAGETQVSNASRPINDEERATCTENGVEWLELAIANDTVAIVRHFDNDWTHDITVDELAMIWAPAAEGTVMRWNQVRASWPDRPLKLYGRGQDSGTYDFFTTEIVGETRASRLDYTASEDEEWLAEQVAADPDALGFFGIGGYHRHWQELRLIPVDSGNGPIYPSLETATNGEYRPLTRPLYVYVNRSDLAERPVLQPWLQ